MKKTFIPSKRMFILLIFGSFFAVLLWSILPSTMWFCFDFFVGGVDIGNRFVGVLFSISIVVVTAMYPVICLVVTFCEVFFFFALRPFKISDELIYLGYFRKKVYKKKDITGLGIAPITEGLLMTKKPSRFQGIYITFGDYNKFDFLEYGILSVWEKVVFCKILPKTMALVHRFENNGFFDKHNSQIRMILDLGPIQDFDGLLWMSYSEERLSFLKAWLGSRFYELTQTE